MPRYTITKFGRGLDTTRNPSLLQPGFAQQSINLLHNFGDDRVKLRGGFLRALANQPGTVNGNFFLYSTLYEFIKNDGTIIKLWAAAKALQSFTTTYATGTTSIGTLSATTVNRFETYLNFCLIANNKNQNYITNGISLYPLDTAAPSTTINAILGNSGNMSVGVYTYGYALYSSITGEISPALQSIYTVTTTSGHQQVTHTPSSPLSTVQQFDSIKFYRTKVGLVAPYYLLATMTITALNAGYVDNIADSSLTVLSTIHDANGAVSTSVVEAAQDIVQHRGRCHFIGLNGAPSRHRWTQLLAYETDSTTDARHDVEPDDGDALVRGISYNGVLVLFKQHSIHIMVGDVDQTGFVWQVVSDKTTGIGAYFPWTVVSTPIGVIFCGEHGVYSYHPMLGLSRISTNIQGTVDSWYSASTDFFRASYDEDLRAYLLITKSSATNYMCHVYYIDTQFWTQFKLCTETVSNPLQFTTFQPMHDANSKIVTYAIDNGAGNLLRYDKTVQTDYADAAYSGTITSINGTTHVIDSTANFTTTGEGIVDADVMLVDLAGNYEIAIVNSNTATDINTGGYVVTLPAVNRKYYVGCLMGILSLGFTDFGEAGYKRITRMTFEFQRQTHSVNLILGFTVDNDAAPTITFVTSQQNFALTIPVNRVGVRIAPYIKTIGNANPFELLRIEVDYLVLPARLPMNR